MEDHHVWKTQQRDALTTEPGVAPVVAEGAAIVRGAVSLDCEPRCCAVEVGEVAADRVLASKLVAQQLAVAK
jgi:hypothetical protein